MSEETVTRLFIQRFQTNYGPANTNDVPAFYAEFTRALGPYDDDILREAANRLIEVPRGQDGRGRFWPTVGECVAVVKAVAEERREIALARNPNHYDQYTKKSVADE